MDTFQVGKGKISMIADSAQEGATALLRMEIEQLPDKVNITFANDAIAKGENIGHGECITDISLERRLFKN